MANLLSNSIKYSHEGTILIKVSHVKELLDNFIEIKVIDNGIGIDDAKNVGEMFKNLEVIANVNQTGIGFGLTISKMIMH